MEALKVHSIERAYTRQELKAKLEKLYEEANQTQLELNRLELTDVTPAIKSSNGYLILNRINGECLLTFKEEDDRKAFLDKIKEISGDNNMDNSVYLTASPSLQLNIYDRGRLIEITFDNPDEIEENALKIAIASLKDLGLRIECTDLRIKTLENLETYTKRLQIIDSIIKQVNER